MAKTSTKCNQSDRIARDNSPIAASIEPRFVHIMGSGTIAASAEMTDHEASPEPTSGNDSIFGSEHQDDQQSADDSTGPNSVKAEHDDENGSASNSNPTMPMQKRRRVTRACDECRRKKIKCDGKQPCTHCSVYSYGR